MTVSRVVNRREGVDAETQKRVEDAIHALDYAPNRIARDVFGVPTPTASDDVAPDPGIVIPRPPHWGGYHLWVEAVELWVEGTARLHDRARWSRTLEPDGGGFRGGRWNATRVQP